MSTFKPLASRLGVAAGLALAASVASAQTVLTLWNWTYQLTWGTYCYHQVAACACKYFYTYRVAGAVVAYSVRERKLEE